MRLTPPTMVTFWLAVILGLAGLLGEIGVLGVAAAYAFWLVFFGWLALVLGLLVKGL